jgi:phosphohistidine phosphatase
MRLYLFRHAEAGYEAASDFDRELTKRGRKRTQTAAQVMLQLGVAPKVIASSPRLRARQTAKIIADELDIPMSIHEELDVAFNARAAALLASQTDPADVMLVGHNPSFEEVVEAITGANVAFKKGALARIDLEAVASPLQGRLVWLIAPKVFDALGK